MTPLGDRQLEALRLLAEGNEQRQVAALMGVSFFTVRAYVRRIQAELGARNTAHAVHIAHQRGLLS